MKEKFSKIIAVSLAVLMVASQVIVPTSAAGTVDYCSECHENGVRGELQHTIEATCGDQGFEIYDCNYVNEKGVECSGTITIAVNPTGVHAGDGNVVAAVAPTCTEDGTVAYELCKGCGCYLEPGTVNKLDSIVDSKTGHAYEPTVTDPDCVNGGYTTYVCSVCEDTYVDDEVKANGHTFVDVPGQSATCREEGYSGYKKCEVCGVEDPEHPKTVLPIEDHNGHFVEEVAATCEEDGRRMFKCEKEDCPYYDVVTEVLPKLGHDEVEHAAKEATCTEMGYDAYVTCTRCDYSTYNEESEVVALGHTYTNKGFVDADCVTEGMTNAVVCDRCDLVHHAGEVIPAKGHTLTVVQAKAPTCTEKGSIQHTVCSVCNKKFAGDAVDGDATIEELTDITVAATGHDYKEAGTEAPKCTEKGKLHFVCEVCQDTYYDEIDALGHKYEDWKQAPTCTENGWLIHTCTVCQHTYSDVIPATGHDFKYVEEVAAKCRVTGVKAHNVCTECNNIFAADEDETNIEAVVLTEDDLVIPALDHVSEVVTGVNPTYNAAGIEAGVKCSLCGEAIVNANELDELDEAIKFHYEITGVNGSNTAVNSGYVTLKIYFDVRKDIDDKEEYNSDVLANIFAIDFAMNYDNSVFNLTTVEVAPGVFAKAAFTSYDKANENGYIAITQDMVNTSKVFRGENNLFATLTFQVATNASAADYTFGLGNLEAFHPEEEVIDVTASEQEVVIEVKALGDANYDGIFTSADTFKVSEYIKNIDVEKEYVAEYDMDKDGDIDFIDLDLIRKAIVGNDEYLEITVDPNEVVTPEV